MKTLTGLALLLAGLLSTADAAEECGRVTIADMNWSSATLMANVDRFVLKHGYGCDARLVPGDSVPTGTSMAEKGEPDIAPEFWINSLKTDLDKGVAEKRLRYAGSSLSDGGEEGFWVPKYMVDKEPSLATIEGVKAHAKLFRQPGDPQRSGFMGCPAGWNCRITSGNLFKALQLEAAGFELIDPGSGAGLAGAITKAYEHREPWFGYYWAPTPILGKYQMVKVDFGSGVDERHYDECITQAGCGSPRPTMYPPSPVYTVTTEAFAVKAPEAYAYLTRRSFSNEQMNELLVWMEENQADGASAMAYFLKNFQGTWIPWVSQAAAVRIRKALGDI